MSMKKSDELLLAGTACSSREKAVRAKSLLRAPSIALALKPKDLSWLSTVQPFQRGSQSVCYLGHEKVPTLALHTIPRDMCRQPMAGLYFLMKLVILTYLSKRSCCAPSKHNRFWNWVQLLQKMSNSEFVQPRMTYVVALQT